MVYIINETDLENRIMHNIVTTAKLHEIDSYRMGDAIIIQNNAKPTILKKYKGTIAYQYLINKCPKSGTKNVNVDRLNKIVDEHIKEKKYQIPNDDDLVLHLRLGDRKLVHSVDELNELITYIEDIVAFKKLIIVTAFHMVSASKDDDSKYGILNELLSYCESNNINVNIRSSNNPDEDFCFLVKAKSLICTKGGYSILAYLCNSNKKYILQDTLKAYYK